MRSQPFTASARETTPTNLLVKCIIPFCQHIPIPTGELNIANLYKNMYSSTRANSLPLAVPFGLMTLLII